MNTKIYISDSFDPRFNLALEDLLFDTVSRNYCTSDSLAILYIWQNENTVVIGKSQNAWRECRVSELESDGGILVRRTSGGGAVYHDKGNLCYTFITDSSNYSLERQLKVILGAVRACGIDAEFSGRNDIITKDGRKFSGNAFRFSKNAGLMHGTLLVDTDGEKLSRYLNVSKAKISAKGVSSVRSRVVNLKEIVPDITTDALTRKLIESFISEYGETGAAPLHLSPVETKVSIGNDEISLISMSESLQGSEDFYKRYQKFASWEWRFGETMPFDINIEKKFGWGLVNAGLTVENGSINKARIETDAMDADLGEVLSAALTGTPLSYEKIKAALDVSMAIIKNSGSMIGDPELIAEDVAEMIAGI